MLELSYTKVIPYPFEVVLSQYFDYEHIAYVHPETLGEYRVLEADGNRIVYEQLWKRNWRGKRPISKVVQTYLPPNEIWFEFIEGLHSLPMAWREVRRSDGREPVRNGEAGLSVYSVVEEEGNLLFRPIIEAI